MSHPFLRIPRSQFFSVDIMNIIDRISDDLLRYIGLEKDVVLMTERQRIDNIAIEEAAAGK